MNAFTGARGTVALSLIVAASLTMWWSLDPLNGVWSPAVALCMMGALIIVLMEVTK